MFGIRLRGSNSPTDPAIDGATIHVHNNEFYNGGARNDAYAYLFQGNQSTFVDATCNWYASEGTPAVYQKPAFTGPVLYIPYNIASGGACTGYPPVLVKRLGVIIDGYTTIQQAISALNTLAGDVIAIAAGTFSETVPLVIDKNLT
ncbi:MAG: hypothetical protein WCI71_02855, partial [Bacteroidota bacterium]